MKSKFIGPNISTIHFTYNIDQYFPNSNRTILGYIFPLLLCNKLSHDSHENLYNCDNTYVVHVLSLYMASYTTNVFCYLMDLRRFVFEESSHYEWAELVGNASKQFIGYFCASMGHEYTREKFIPHQIMANINTYKCGMIAVMTNTSYFTSYVQFMILYYETHFQNGNLKFVDLSKGVDSMCVQLIIHLFYKYGQSFLHNTICSLVDNQDNGVLPLSLSSGVKRRKLMGDTMCIQCWDTDNFIGFENCHLCSVAFRRNLRNSENVLLSFQNRHVYVIALTLYNIILSYNGGEMVWDSRLISDYIVYNRVSFGKDKYNSIKNKINVINKLSHLSTYHQGRLQIIAQITKPVQLSLSDFVNELKLKAVNSGLTKSHMISTEIKNNDKSSEIAYLNIIDKNKVLTVKIASGNSLLLPFFDESRLSEKPSFVRHTNSVAMSPVNCTFSRYKTSNGRYGGDNINTYNLNISGNKLDILLATKVIEINTQKIFRRSMYSHVINNFFMRNNCSTVDIGGVLNEFAFRHKYRISERNILNGSCKNLKAVRNTCFPAYNTYTQLEDKDVMGIYNIPMRDRCVVDNRGRSDLLFEMQLHRKNFNTSKLCGMDLKRCVVDELTNLLNCRDQSNKRVVEYNIKLNNIKAIIERRSTNLLCKAVNLFLEFYYLFSNPDEIPHKNNILTKLFVSRDMICTYGSFNYINNYGTLYKKESINFISSKYHISEVQEHFAIDSDMLLEIYEQYPFDLGLLHKPIMKWKKMKLKKNPDKCKPILKFSDSRTTGIMGYLLFGSKRFIQSVFKILLIRLQTRTPDDCKEYLHMINIIKSYISDE
jgi:hypothetical protein